MPQISEPVVPVVPVLVEVGEPVVPPGTHWQVATLQASPRLAQPSAAQSQPPVLPAVLVALLELELVLVLVAVEWVPVPPVVLVDVEAAVECVPVEVPVVTWAPVVPVVTCAPVVPLALEPDVVRCKPVVPDVPAEVPEALVDPRACDPDDPVPDEAAVIT